jgi:predicted ribosome quality control (RQC) complex YloA/Tae2 family protein
MIIEQFKSYELLLGKNKKENDKLITECSDNDYWVHISEYPSGHCIIVNEKDEKIPRNILKRACCLVKQHSKYSSCKNIEFDITQIKYIEKTNILGEVLVNKILKQIII